MIIGWLAVCFSLLGVFLQAKKKRMAWVILIIAQSLWVIRNIETKLWDQLTLSLILLFIFIYGWLNWRDHA